MKFATRPATASDFSQIRKLYQECGYSGKITAEDQIFVALWKDQIVGAVRICFENNCFLLRGMYLHPKFQHKGIGTRLLRDVNDWLQHRECYCIPFKWLHPFYSRIGFERIKAEEAPAFLAARTRDYLNKGHDVVMMCRQGA